jgi:hypothetical protein
MIHNHQTAATRFDETNGIRFAYRRFPLWSLEQFLDARYRFQLRRRHIMIDKPIKIPRPDHPITIEANPSAS